MPNIPIFIEGETKYVPYEKSVEVNHKYAATSEQAQHLEDLQNMLAEEQNKTNRRAN